MYRYHVISDLYAHFTLEYLELLPWNSISELRYFECDQSKIEGEIIRLLNAHWMMVQILDECFEGGLGNDAKRQKLWHEIYSIICG
jgi:hypothetical protein